MIHSRSPVKTALVLWLLVLPALSATPSPGQDAAAFLTAVRDSYAERTPYADVGEIEILRQADGIESSELHFFETAATRGAGLVWRVMMASDHGFDDLTVWLTGDSVMMYDGGLRQAKPADSMEAAIQEILGETAGRALVIPFWLALGQSPPALDAHFADAALSPPRPCLDDDECRLLTVPLSEDSSLDLLVEVDTLWVHDVELVTNLNGETTTVRIRHSESPLGDVSPEARASFSPPPSTVTVPDWEGVGAAEDGDDSFDPLEQFFEVITVDVFTVTARIVGDSGHPIPGLRPEDLKATIGGREFPVVAVDWQGPDLVAEDGNKGEGEQRGAMARVARNSPEGRQIVIFLQNDFEPSRVKGQMKLFGGLRRMVDNFAPRDRVAVLSFFAHLKLWQDFTSDKAAVKASLERAFFPGATPGLVEPDGHPALLDVFDPKAARRVANSVEALRYTADALAAVPGDKDIIFFGYGLEGGNERPMLRALQQAKASTFVLDTTQADFHTLGAGLMTMAQATGGTYDSSYNYAGQALRKVERMITGRYLITVDRSQMPEARGRVRIQLANGPGKVLMTPSGFSG